MDELVADNDLDMSTESLLKLNGSAVIISEGIENNMISAELKKLLDELKDDIKFID